MCVCEVGQLPGYRRSSYLHVLPEQHDKKQLAYCVCCWYMENIEPAFIWDVFHHHSRVSYVRVCCLRDVPFRQYVSVWTRCCVLVCLSTAPTRGYFVYVWVNRNDRCLELVDISDSRSGDRDDRCRRALTPCNLLSWYCCFGGTCCGTWRKVSDAGKGVNGSDCKWISGRILFLYPEDWGSRFLWHVATCLLNYTAFCTRWR